MAEDDNGVSYLLNKIFTQHWRDPRYTFQNKFRTMGFVFLFWMFSGITGKGRTDVVAKHTQRSIGNTSIGHYQWYHVTWSTNSISCTNASAKHIWWRVWSNSEKRSWTCLQCTSRAVERYLLNSNLFLRVNFIYLETFTFKYFVFQRVCIIFSAILASYNP